MLAFRFRPLLAGLALSLWAGASFAQAAPCDDPAVARTAGAVSLAYQDLGEADRPAVILVAGTDQQMIDSYGGSADYSDRATTADFVAAVRAQRSMSGSHISAPLPV